MSITASNARFNLKKVMAELKRMAQQSKAARLRLRKDKDITAKGKDPFSSSGIMTLRWELWDFFQSETRLWQNAFCRLPRKIKA